MHMQNHEFGIPQQEEKAGVSSIEEEDIFMYGETR